MTHIKRIFSASEVTALWRYTDLFIIIIVIIYALRGGIIVDLSSQ